MTYRNTVPDNIIQNSPSTRLEAFGLTIHLINSYYPSKPRSNIIIVLSLEI